MTRRLYEILFIATGIAIVFVFTLWVSISFFKNQLSPRKFSSPENVNSTSPATSPSQSPPELTTDAVYYSMPPSPNALEATPTNYGYHIRWEKVDLEIIAGYRLYRQDCSGNWNLVYAGQALTFEDRNPPKNCGFGYRITSFNIYGNESTSGIEEVRVPPNN